MSTDETSTPQQPALATEGTDPTELREHSLPHQPLPEHSLPEPRFHEAPQLTATPAAVRTLPWVELLMAILTWFASIVLLIVVPVIVALPYFIYVWRTRGVPNAEALANDKTFLFISIVGVVPTHLLTLAVIWLVVTRGRKRPFWKTIGFEWPESISPLAGFGACLLISIALLAVGAFVTWIWGGGKTQLDLLVESSIPARLATAFVAVFTAPLVEELIYRGVLYSAIQRTVGTGVAVLAVSALFAGVHVFQYVNNLAVILVITLLSITLTLVRAYSGKVLPSFVIHLIFNGVQSIIIALAPFFGWGS